nr:hypothetical protein [Bifidobacterium catenulatum]
MLKEASEKNVVKFKTREQSDQLPCPDFAWILLSNRLGQDSVGKQKSQELLWFLTFIGSGAWIWTMDLWGYAPAHGPNPCRPEPIITNPSGVRHDDVP